MTPDIRLEGPIKTTENLTNDDVLLGYDAA
jgi:hypothetical protein